MNNTFGNSGAEMSVEVSAFSSFEYVPGSEITAHTVPLCLTFLGTFKQFPTLTVPFHISLTMNDGSNFYTGFPGGSVLKNLPANLGDTGSIPGSGRCSGEGKGNPLLYSCLSNPMDGGAWQA